MKVVYASCEQCEFTVPFTSNNKTFLFCKAHKIGIDIANGKLKDLVRHTCKDSWEEYVLDDEDNVCPICGGYLGVMYAHEQFSEGEIEKIYIKCGMLNQDKRNSPTLTDKVKAKEIVKNFVNTTFGYIVSQNSDKGIIWVCADNFSAIKVNNRWKKAPPPTADDLKENFEAVEDFELATKYFLEASRFINQDKKGGEKIKVVMQRVVMIFFLLLGITSIVYWFQIKPSEIRKSCAAEAESIAKDEDDLVLGNNHYRYCLTQNGLKPESLYVNVEDY